MKKKQRWIQFTLISIGLFLFVVTYLYYPRMFEDKLLKDQSITENFGKRDFHIHIGMSPPKSHERVEWFVEKAVEIGIHEISFIQTQFSERKMIKLNRILKRAVSSMKQSLNANLPVINKIIPKVIPNFRRSLFSLLIFFISSNKS